MMQSESVRPWVDTTNQVYHMQILAYGIAANCIDKYLKIGASIALECMKKFCLDVIQVFREKYRRKPNQANIDCLLQVAKADDFSSMLGCIDRLH